MKKIIKIQFFILLIGSVFSWTNFINELFAWLNKQACENNCLATGEVVNPFLSDSFYSALFFALALILNLLLLLASREKKTAPEDKSAEESNNNQAGPA